MRKKRAQTMVARRQRIIGTLEGCRSLSELAHLLSAAATRRLVRLCPSQTRSMAVMGISKTPQICDGLENRAPGKKKFIFPPNKVDDTNKGEGEDARRARERTCARPTAFAVRYACHRDTDLRTCGTAPCSRLRAVPRPCGTAGACAARACWIDPGAARATTTRCIGSARGTEPPSNVHSGGNGHRFSGLSQRF